MGFHTKRGGRKASAPKDDNTALKIKLRGQDNVPLTMPELREALLEAARQLKEYEPGYRAKFATIYLTMVDANGEPVRINHANELTIYPYKTAAEENGL
ncbi:hypothetical protein [Sinorhizobium meliloti]|uniref:hypothetical protein n=1 Tax=Rhizobium meliloti TaxID=382 RepID=UPI000FDBC998|nr:hypothetical protein [Sinorhizobium meliloti]RVI30877.1 hypothetical protein CN207_07490 [Sinorhizobium meliloti]